MEQKKRRFCKVCALASRIGRIQAANLAYSRRRVRLQRPPGKRLKRREQMALIEASTL